MRNIFIIDYAVNLCNIADVIETINVTYFSFMDNGVYNGCYPETTAYNHQNYVAMA